MKVYYCFPGGKTKALTMSYDDAKFQDRKLVSIFNKYGIRGTFNLNYGTLGKAPIISAEEVSTLYQGHEIATHTLNHPVIGRCPLPLVAEEILEDRKGLESLTGQVVRGHAYPNGSYNKEIETLLQGLGIVYGRVVQSIPSFELPDNPMEWHPTCHHSDPNLMEYGSFFINFSKKQYLKLMYVWGHSYEFDRNERGNNWETIEEFCKLMGNRSDIWYATNIEIIDYLESVKRLRYTAAADTVYNPSVESVWINLDGLKTIEAKSGCFTKLSLE